MSEIDNFFKDLPSDSTQKADIFEEPKEPLEKEEKPEEGDQKESRKNRRERRLEERLSRTEEMNVALNERIIELSESKKFNQEFKSDSVPVEWIALYGDTPEAKKAWEVNQVLMNRAKQEAKEEALQEFEQRRTSETKQVKEFEGLIDSELESLEDEYDVDLTSNAPSARKARREFLELVEELSPKDDDGTILGYADFDKTFEIYQNSRKQEKDPTVDRRKEFASRSMNRGGGTAKELPEGPMNWDAAKKAIRDSLNLNS